MAQTFTDVTVAAGFTGGQGSWSAVWADYNGDGFLDVMTTGHLQAVLGGKNKLYRSNGNGTFTDVTASVGMVSDRIDTHSAVWADFDRDGDLDLLMLNEPVDGKTWLYNELWRNNNDGTFTDVSTTAGVTVIDHITKGVATADIDRDGYLDILEVVQDLDRVPGGTQSYSPNNLLLRNNGNLTFTEIAASAGVQMGSAGEKRTATFADFNNDGWPDLMVMPDCSLFVNNGNLTFTDVTATSGIPRSAQCQGAAWADFDNDGDLDVYVTRGFDLQTSTSLYRNNGDSTFTDITATAGVGVTQLSRGAIWGDYDNDGLIDLYVVSLKNANNPNRLFKNNGNATFTDVSVSTGTTAQVAGNGADASFIDYDNDGDLDLFVTNGEGNGTGPFLLLANSGTTNQWLKLKLKGVSSNPDAVGTRVRMNTATVSRYAVQSGQSHWMGQNTVPVHLGMGAETAVTSLVLSWPNGLQQTVENIAAGQTVTVEEGSPLYAGPATLTGEGYVISRTDNRWRVEWRGTSSTSRFTGRISALAGGTLSAVAGVGLESNDRITVAADSRSFTYASSENGSGSDAIEFTSAATSIRFDVKQDGLGRPAKVRLGKHAVKPATLPLTVKQ